MKNGNCYGATEALYNLLGGKDSGWDVMKIPGKPSHWFLRHKLHGIVLDVTRSQFDKLPDYSTGIRAAFFPVKSKRAQFLESVIVWREDVDRATELFNA